MLSVSKLRSAIVSDNFNLGLIYPLEVTENLILENLPVRGFGANEDKIAHRLPLNDCLDSHYLSLNPKREVRVAIVVDVDSDLDVDLMKSLNIPLPKTFTGRRSIQNCDDRSVRPHLIYWLSKPVFMMNKKQAQKYDRVIKRLRGCLETICDVDAIDPTITKNPAKLEWRTWDPVWHVIKGDDRIWSLDELDDALSRAKVVPIKKVDKPANSDARNVPKYQAGMANSFREDVAARGRHEQLFEAMRFFAYAHKANASSEQDLFNYVLEQCLKFNELNNAHNLLSYSSIKSTAKSIARWTWRYYTGSGEDKDRGACKREGLVHAGMSKKQRQAVGGRYGAKKNADAKKQKVLAALEDLKASGEPVVISKLAKELEMSRNTLKKYMQETVSEKVQNADVQASEQVVKTVSIREGSAKDAGDEPTYGEKITAFIGDDVVEMWPVIGSDGLVVNKHGVQMPAMYFDGYLKSTDEGPKVIEIPDFLM